MTKTSYTPSALTLVAKTPAAGRARAHAHRHGKTIHMRTRLAAACLMMLGGSIASAFAANTPPTAFSVVQIGGRLSPAPLLNQRTPDAIPDQYIIVFKQGTDSKTVKSAQATATSLGGRIGFTYTAALVGFSAMLTPAALNSMLANPSVDYVEADQRVSGSTIQPSAPTGLDRTSERPAGLDTKYTYTETGLGVHAYVIDSGIRVTHSDFGTRASWSFTSIAPDANDCHGHGTHVAGIIGGTTYGIAKNVQLRAVRVLDCSNSGTESGVIAGVDWVTINAIKPAVANMSLGAPVALLALNTAVANSIASGIVYTVAAGNNFGFDACSASPALVPSAITVGAMNPVNDTVSAFSNAGPCLDLYAPGEAITSTWNTSDGATNTIDGTSMAAPHVAGVVAKRLQNYPLDTPSAVWTHLHDNTNNVSTTPNWPAGLLSLPPNSPNELLHYGSLDDGATDGDPHLTTVNGVHYDFQSAGEFVALRDGNGMQIQTRQIPVQTVMNPGVSPYSGLASCVSLNTAVAARVGAKRVTYQPNISGIPDPSGMQLRVDGALTTLGQQGVMLAPGGRVAKAPVGDGIQIDFPDGTVMTALSNYWPSQGKWYLNVKVMGTRAKEGILGPIAPGSWLPALPDGSAFGLRPAALHDRYVDLNETFADAWRVTDVTSLFDYAPGTSTQNFTVDAWPLESPPCVLLGSDDIPAQPLDQGAATDLCRPVTGKDANANCVFDVMVTGEPGLAKTYQFSQQIATGATTTRVYDNIDPTPVGAAVTFSATVARSATRGSKAVPKGSVQFSIDGKDVGAPVVLNKKGVALWTTALDKPGAVKVAARFVPAQGSVFLPSTSLDELHTVR
jgi:hypothetical protein